MLTEARIATSIVCLMLCAGCSSQNGMANSCKADSDCYVGLQCLQGSCGRPGCADDAQCAPYRCEIDCATSCKTDMDCSAGNACSNGVCAPHACDGPAECGGFACEAGTCTTQCEGVGSTNACDPGLLCSATGTCACPGMGTNCGLYKCQNNACAFPCQSAGDCVAGTCDEGTCTRCAGTPAPCGAYGAMNHCNQVPGCSWRTTCASPTYCPRYLEPDCTPAVGCVWNSATASCEDACPGQTVCPTNSGCMLVSSCTTIQFVPCNGLDPTTCATVAGCNVY